MIACLNFKKYNSLTLTLHLSNVSWISRIKIVFHVLRYFKTISVSPDPNASSQLSKREMARWEGGGASRRAGQYTNTPTDHSRFILRLAYAIFILEEQKKLFCVCVCARVCCAFTWKCIKNLSGLQNPAQLFFASIRLHRAGRNEPVVCGKRLVPDLKRVETLCDTFLWSATLTM